MIFQIIFWAWLKKEHFKKTAKHNFRLFDVSVFLCVLYAELCKVVYKTVQILCHFFGWFSNQLSLKP